MLDREILVPTKTERRTKKKHSFQTICWSLDLGYKLIHAIERGAEHLYSHSTIRLRENISRSINFVPNKYTWHSGGGGGRDVYIKQHKIDTSVVGHLAIIDAGLFE